MTPPFSRGTPPHIVKIRRYLSFLEKQKNEFWLFGHRHRQHDESFLAGLLIAPEDLSIYATHEEREAINVFIKEFSQTLEHVSRRRFILLLGMVTVTSRFFYKRQIRLLEESKQPLSIDNLVQKLRTSYQRAISYANKGSSLPTFVKNSASYVVERILGRLI